MEHWQFLIQKQGDRSWRLLESPNVEIMEGRYRIVARSNYISTDVEVRVTHYSIEEVPPKRRIQTRSRRTNTEGLMAVIPFTYLLPGIWDLRCNGDLMSDLLGKSWQYSVHLQVLSNVDSPYVRIDHQDEGRTSFSDDSETFTEEPINPVWLKADTAEQILKHLIDLALPTQPLLDDEITVEKPLPEPPLLLTLDRETYFARWGQTLTVSGRVDLKPTTELNLGEIDFESVCAVELRIELRSPLGAERLSLVRQPLPKKSLPLEVEAKVEIPGECESKLILGDISLYGALADASEVILLASHCFTIAADVIELLAISTIELSQREESESLKTTEAGETFVPLKLELFNLVKPTKTNLPLHVSSEKCLPPLIAGRSLSKSTSPQLPSVTQSENQIMTTTAVMSKVSVPKLLEKNDIISAASRVASTKTTFPYLRRLKALPFDSEEARRHAPALEQEDATSELVDNNTQLQDDSVAVVVSASSELITEDSPYLSPLIRQWMHSQGYSLLEPINLHYQDDYDIYAVKSHETRVERTLEKPLEDVELLKNRGTDDSLELTDRLSATSGEDTEKWAKAGDTVTYLTDVVMEVTDRFSTASPSRKTKTVIFTEEVVVEDTFNKEETNTIQNPSAIEFASSVLELVALESLPVPQLHLPNGELISGKSIVVRVRLVEERPQVAVKLWVEDCQTRRLLDEPRLLTNLLPNFKGGLEVMTYINVPFGCLEIRVEAIAINMATQLESDKVSLHRTVIPPDLPTLQLDELLGI
ncbi:MAG: hypothetical protein PUP93_03385 [Rhizonema sp. NSF051]|nr:hypothetical protein [Rhizonema sp. NSF051]